MRLSKSTLNPAIKEGKIGLSPPMKGPLNKISDVLLSQGCCDKWVKLEIRANCEKEISIDFWEMQFMEPSTMVSSVLNQHGGSFVVTFLKNKSKMENSWQPETVVWWCKNGFGVNWTGYKQRSQRWGWNFHFRVGVYSDKVTCRIINMDKTHHNMSITGNKGGSRALVYLNPHVQQGYKKKREGE